MVRLGGDGHRRGRADRARSGAVLDVQAVSALCPNIAVVGWEALSLKRAT
jgi:hypothetical protein